MTSKNNVGASFQAIGCDIWLVICICVSEEVL